MTWKLNKIYLSIVWQISLVNLLSKQEWYSRQNIQTFRIETKTQHFKKKKNYTPTTKGPNFNNITCK